MSSPNPWSSHTDIDSGSTANSGPDTRMIVLWIVVSLVGLALVLIVLQCWKRHRITKRAKLAHQDAVLNMPVAIPWDVSELPYAQVVDIAATAPDHDELLPATEPEFRLPRS